MRIAFVTSQFQGTDGATFSSGPANYLLRVSRSLVSLGHRPVIISIGARDDHSEDAGVEFASVSGKRAGRATRLRAGTLHIHSYMSGRLNARLDDIHRAEPVDIVQYTNYRATALHRVASIPAVMRVSSFRPLWDAPDSAERTLGRRVAARLELKSFSQVDALYAPSRLVAEAVTDATGRTVEVVEPPFYPEVHEYDRSLLEHELADTPFVLFVGSMTERKGLPVLAESVADLCARYPDLHVVLAGRDKPYRNGTMVEYVRRVADPGNNRLHYLGEVPHAQLYPLYEAAQAVVLPSLVDNLPNSCLEALALGAIVVGTEGASFEQLITDGVHGFLADRGDVASLTKTVVRALQLAPHERVAMAAAARERMARMSPAVAVSELLSYYTRVIEDGQVG